MTQWEASFAALSMAIPQARWLVSRSGWGVAPCRYYPLSNTNVSHWLGNNQPPIVRGSVGVNHPYSPDWIVAAIAMIEHYIATIQHCTNHY